MLLERLVGYHLNASSLQLLLFEAERAWAYAQDLVAQSTLPANSAHAGTLRHSATGRFRRAVHWSTQLLSHCQALYAAEKIPAAHLVQATVYTLVLNGRFLRYRDDFEDALVQLSIARYLLDQLAEWAMTSRDQALATLFADEIGPEIRYCAHELGREKAYDVDAIVTELAKKHRSEIVDGCDAVLQKLKQEGEGSSEARKKLETLMWEGQPIPVRNPELVDVLLRVQEAEAKIAAPREALENRGTGDKRKQKGRLGSKKGVAAYDAVLSALSDAEEVARKLAEAHQARTSSSSSGYYLRWDRAQATVQRPWLAPATSSSCMHTLFTSCCPTAYSETCCSSPLYSIHTHHQGKVDQRGKSRWMVGYILL